LEDHQRDKIDALADGVEVGELFLCVTIETGRVVFESKDESVEWNTSVLIHVVEEHAMRADRFHDANKEVGLYIQPHGDQMVLLMVARWQREKVEFFLFHHHT